MRIVCIQGRGIATKIAWICGHAGLLPNEIADEAAKEAAHSAIEEDLPLTVTTSGAKWMIRQHLTEKWQESWDRGQTGRLLHNIIPRVNSRTHTRQLPRSVETQINRL